MTSRLRRALSGALFYTIATVLERVVLLALLPFITRTVSVSEFAGFALLRIGIQIAHLGCDAGTGLATVRLVADHSDRGARDRIVATLLATRAVLGLAAMFAAWSVLRAVPPSFLTPKTLETIAMLTAVSFFFTSFGDAEASALRAEERHGLVALGWISRGVIAGIGYVVLVLVMKQGLMGLMTALCAGEVAAAIVLAPALGALVDRGARPSAKTFRELLTYGVPAALSLLSPVLGALDRYVVQRLASLEAAAFYHLANGPAFAIDLAKRAAISALEPYVFGVDSAEAPRELERLTRIYAWLMACLAIALSAFAPEIIRLLAPSEYRAAVGAVPALAFAAVLQAVFRMVALGSGLAKRTRVWAIAGLFDLSLVLVLLIALVPRFGVLGAGLARFASSLVGLLACGVLTERVFSGRLPVMRTCLIGTVGMMVSSMTLSWSLRERVLVLVAMAAASAIVLGVRVRRTN